MIDSENPLVDPYVGGDGVPLKVGDLVLGKNYDANCCAVFKVIGLHTNGYGTKLVEVEGVWGYLEPLKPDNKMVLNTTYFFKYPEGLPITKEAITMYRAMQGIEPDKVYLNG